MMHKEPQLMLAGVEEAAGMMSPKPGSATGHEAGVYITATFIQRLIPVVALVQVPMALVVVPKMAWCAQL